MASIFDQENQDKSMSTFYNFDEMGVFLELSLDYTLDIHSKQNIGVSTHAKQKEPIIVVLAISSEDDMILLMIIFKATKPRDKSYMIVLC